MGLPSPGAASPPLPASASVRHLVPEEGGAPDGEGVHLCRLCARTAPHHQAARQRLLQLLWRPLLRPTTHACLLLLLPLRPRRRRRG